MSEFKEYEEWEASLDQNYLKQLSPDAFELSPDAFYAGQQSQQAKIDLLEVQLKGAEERAKLTLDHKNKMVDELQARVDVVLRACDNLRKDIIREHHAEYDKGWKDCATSIYHQLKGNKYEN